MAEFAVNFLVDLVQEIIKKCKEIRSIPKIRDEALALLVKLSPVVYEVETKIKDPQHRIVIESLRGSLTEIEDVVDYIIANPNTAKIWSSSYLKKLRKAMNSVDTWISRSQAITLSLSQDTRMKLEELREMTTACELTIGAEINMLKEELTQVLDNEDTGTEKIQQIHKMIAQHSLMGKTERFRQFFDEEDERFLRMAETAAAKHANIPIHLLCPISLELLEDPVMVTVSGYTYSKKALNKYTAGRYREGKKILDPITRDEFDPKCHIMPNRALVDVLNNWKEDCFQYLSDSLEAPRKKKFKNLVAPEIVEEKEKAERERVEKEQTEREKEAKLLETQLYRLKSKEDFSSIAKIVRDGTPNGKENAAKVLIDLAYNNADNKVKIADAGAIKPLITLLTTGTDEGKTNAAGALWNLAGNADNQVKIADAGAIEPLITLLTTGTDEGKTWATGALVNLAANADNKVKIADAGAIEPLIALLTTGTDEGKTQAAWALVNLAANADNEVKIADAGAIEPLITLVRDGRSAEARKQGAWALLNIGWSKSDIQRKIKDAGLQTIQTAHDKESDNDAKGKMKELLDKIK